MCRFCKALLILLLTVSSASVAVALPQCDSEGEQLSTQRALELPELFSHHAQPIKLTGVGGKIKQALSGCTVDVEVNGQYVCSYSCNSGGCQKCIDGCINGGACGNCPAL